MRLERSWMLLALFVAATPLQARAYSPDETPPDQQTIAALEARIVQAEPREQCFLKAQLIHKMTEFSVRQYAAGDVEKADAMLMRVRDLAHKLHLTMADDNKRLKNAEILLRHSAFRLNEMLHTSSFEDRPLVEETLAQVNKVDTDAMMQVFKK